MAWIRWRDLDRVYERDLKRYGNLRHTREAEAALCKRKDAGDRDAFDSLFHSQIQWCVKIANKYVGHGCDVDDLIQAANMGLMRAIETFDSTKARLSTYCTQMIIHSVRDELAYHSRTVRVPSYLQFQTANKVDVPPIVDRLIRNRVKNMTALDARDLKTKDNPAQEVCDKDFQEAIQDCICFLTAKERDILARRMNGETLLKIAKRRGITKERVRQILLVIYRKLNEMMKEEAT